MKKCPFCAKEIQDDAIFCRHCRNWLNEAEGLASESKPETEKSFDSEKSSNKVQAFKKNVERKKKKSSYWIYFFLGAIIGIALTFAARWRGLISAADTMFGWMTNFYFYGAIGFAICALKNREFKKLWFSLLIIIVGASLQGILFLGITRASSPTSLQVTVPTMIPATKVSYVTREIPVVVTATTAPLPTFTQQEAENILEDHGYVRATNISCTFPECFGWYKTDTYAGVVLGGCDGRVYGVSFVWDNNVEDAMKNSADTETILDALPFVSVEQIKQLQLGTSITVNGWTISSNVDSLTFNHPNMCIRIPTPQYTETSEPGVDLNAPGARYMLDQYGQRVPYIEGKGTLQIAGYYQAPNGKWYPVRPPSTTSTPHPGKHWCQLASDELCLTSWANNPTPSN